MEITMTTAAVQLLVALHVISVAVGRGPPRLVSDSYQRRRVLRAGVNLRLVCPVESPPPPPIITWTKDGEAVHLGWERYRVHGGVLRVRDVNVADSGVFVCHATNGFGTLDVKFLVYVYVESNDTTLPPDDFDEDIFHPASADVAPRFTINDRLLSNSLSPLAGTTVELLCSAVGRPPPRVTWYKDGVELSRDQSLLIPEVTSSDSGRYYCHVRNRAGSVNRTYVVDVDVANADKSVQIVRPYPVNRTVSVSSSASFSCHIHTDSAAPPNVQWLKRVDTGDAGRHNGTVAFNHDGEQYVLLQTSTSTTRQRDGSYISRLTLSRVTSSDVGLYVCVVSGRYGVRSYRAAALALLTTRNDDDEAGFAGLDGLSLMPVVAGVMVLFVIIVFIAVLVVVVRRRRSTSSKAAAAAVVSSTSPGTAASSALLNGQRVSCGSSVMTTPHQMDRHMFHQHYAELRDRPVGAMVTHSRLTRPPPSPPVPATTNSVASPFLSYSSISNTAAVPPGSQSPQLHHHQHAYQLQQQPHPHLQYYERC